MIDNITFKGRIRPVVYGTTSRFDQVSIIRNSTTKIVPTTSYLNSPVTAAQIEILPSTEVLAGITWEALTIKLPVAAAVAGQNMIHNGLDVLQCELKCIRRLVKWVLLSYQFNEREIAFYLEKLEVQSAELTWHTETANRRAALLAQARTIAHFMALQKIKGRHDVQVVDVDIWIRNGKTCMLVTFKDGSQFRQYIKAEQATSRTKGNRRACFVSKTMRQHFDVIVAAIDTHLRNEVILSYELMKKLGILHPRKWTIAAIEAAIEAVMTMGRLNQRRVTKPSDLVRDGLSPEVLETADRHFAGKSNTDRLSPQVLSKHRKLLASKRLDIAEARRPSRSQSIARAGLQIQYAKRWVPGDEARGFGICQESAAAITKLLEHAQVDLRGAYDQDEDGVL
jgi:hypothetical protein